MNKEREISIAELFWRILLGWRSIIVAAVVFTLLLSGYSFLQYSKAQKEYESKVAEYEAALKDAETAESEQSGESAAHYLLDEAKAAKVGVKKEEISIANVAIELKSVLREREKYLAASLYMNTDPYNERVFTEILELVPEYSDTNYAQSFIDYVNSGAFAEKYSDVFKDADVQSVEELISADISGKSATNTMSVFADVSELRTVTLRVIIPEGISETEVMAVTDVAVRECTEELYGGKGLSYATVVSKNTVSIVDENLAKAKYNVANELNTIRNNFQTNYDKLSAEAKAYIDSLFAETSDGVEAVLTEPVKPGFSKKYVLLGFVLGIFLAVVFIVCKVIFASKLVSRSELESMFGLRLLGVVNSGKKYSGIDKWLVSLQNRSEKQMDGNQRLEILSSNLELTCRKEELDSIVLTGSNIELLEKETIDALCSRLKNAGVEATVCSSICYDMAALRKTAEIGTAVLVEKVGESSYREIEKEINELHNNDVRLLGCICAVRM